MKRIKNHERHNLSEPDLNVRSYILRWHGLAVGNIPAAIGDAHMLQHFHNKNTALVKEIDLGKLRAILHIVQLCVMVSSAVGVFADRSPESGRKALFAQLVRATSYSLVKGCCPALLR